MTFWRAATLILAAVAVSGCGAAKAARDTGVMFDKYACLSREFRGEPPCEPVEPPR